jgi:hypothetical protein
VAIEKIGLTCTKHRDPYLSAYSRTKNTSLTRSRDSLDTITERTEGSRAFPESLNVDWG